MNYKTKNLRIILNILQNQNEGTTFPLDLIERREARIKPYSFNITLGVLEDALKELKEIQNE